MHQIEYRDVSRETFDAADQLIAEYYEDLQTYQQHLTWWNRRVNLVSRDITDHQVWQHLRHSLLCCGLPFFRESELIVDSGTGGGLPGLPLALTHPNKPFILNDISLKKCRVVQQISRQLFCTNIEVASGSIEDLRSLSPFLLISKHTFKIDDLYSMIRGREWTGLILYKGLPFEHELENVNDPLTITSYRLETGTDNDFYKDKALVYIQPSPNG